MTWTHIYDFVSKILSLLITVFIIIFINDYVKLGFFIFLLILLLFIAIYILLFRTLATYLYCRYTLKMSLRYSQAKNLNDAFTPLISANMEWLPMKELRDIDNPNKYQLALDIYNKWDESKKEKRKQQIQAFKNSKLIIKISGILLIIIFLYLIIAVFANLPPSNYLTEFYCKAFDTNRYYPMFNLILLFIPVVLVYLVIYKLVEKK